MLCLPALRRWKLVLSAPELRLVGTHFVAAAGALDLTTVAPASASTNEAKGPGSKVLKSNTQMSLSGPMA